MNNPHGDTVTTIPLTGTEAGQGINGWAQYDEYGNQLTDTANTGTTTYGWHGADQRALDTSGLILMGARLYNSITGLFTSRDPIEGGNTTTYAYPQDPIGMNDISGLYSWDKFWNDASNLLTTAVVIPGRVGKYAEKLGQVFGFASGAYYSRTGQPRKAAGAVVGGFIPIPGVSSWAGGRLYDFGSRKPHRIAGGSKYKGGGSRVTLMGEYNRHRKSYHKKNRSYSHNRYSKRYAYKRPAYKAPWYSRYNRYYRSR